MTLRRALNVVYSMLVDRCGDDHDRVEILDRRLRVKFWSEMTPEERRWEELRRDAEDSGAIKGQQTLLGLMGKQGLVGKPQVGS